MHAFKSSVLSTPWMLTQQEMRKKDREVEDELRRTKEKERELLEWRKRREGRRREFMERAKDRERREAEWRRKVEKEMDEGALI
jgi:hypothetical protein